MSSRGPHSALRKPLPIFSTVEVGLLGFNSSQVGLGSRLSLNWFLPLTKRTAIAYVATGISKITAGQFGGFGVSLSQTVNQKRLKLILGASAEKIWTLQETDPPSHDSLGNWIPSLYREYPNRVNYNLTGPWIELEFRVVEDFFLATDIRWLPADKNKNILWKITATLKKGG